MIFVVIAKMTKMMRIPEDGYDDDDNYHDDHDDDDDDDDYHDDHDDDDDIHHHDNGRECVYGRERESYKKR